ncbi:MAG TPA: porin [Casimicrobiaceae bacterium]|nr:porin [Casimicrobiaceae bacterium]
MRARQVALAVVFALSATAYAQPASVTLYGRLNLDVEVVNGKQGGDSCPDNCPNPNQYRVSSNASMFGIRGVESLGGGVNAIFQVESKLFLDTGGGILAGRESFLGLQSPWGTVKLGFFLSPYDDIQPIFGNAPTLTTSILSTGALWAQAYLGPALAGGFDGRLANSVRYDSPTIRGFNGSIQYSTAEGSPTTSSGILSVGGFYTNGPLQLGAAYELHHNIRGTIDAPLSDQAFSVAGGYQFEGVRIGAVYERLRYDVTPSTDLTRNLVGVGVTLDVGPGLLYGYWGRAGNGGGSAAPGSNVGGLVKGDNTGATQWEVSYTYPLSSRTLVYAGYVKIDNQSNASYTFDTNPYPVLCNPYPNGACGRPGGVIAGIAHFF